MLRAAVLLVIIASALPGCVAPGRVARTPTQPSLTVADGVAEAIFLGGRGPVAWDLGTGFLPFAMTVEEPTARSLEPDGQSLAHAPPFIAPADRDSP